MNREAIKENIKTIIRTNAERKLKEQKGIKARAKAATVMFGMDAAFDYFVPWDDFLNAFMDEHGNLLPEAGDNLYEAVRLQFEWFLTIMTELQKRDKNEIVKKSMILLQTYQEGDAVSFEGVLGLESEISGE